MELMGDNSLKCVLSFPQVVGTSLQDKKTEGETQVKDKLYSGHMVRMGNSNILRGVLSQKDCLISSPVLRRGSEKCRGRKHR